MSHPHYFSSQFTDGALRRTFLAVAAFLTLASGAASASSTETFRYSNGLWELAALDAPSTDASNVSGRFSAVLDVSNVSEAAPDSAQDDASSARGVFGELGAFDSTRLSSSVDDLSPLAPSRSETAPRSQATYNGSTFSFSQDVVVRGSVRLPELKSFQFWGNGYLGSGSVNPEKWGGDVDVNATGAQVGLNMPMGSLNFTAYYNYHRNRVKYDGRSVRQNNHSFGAGVYLHAGGFYFTALGGYGDDGYDAKGGEVGSASYDGYQATGYFETGYEMHTLGLFVLKPFGSYQYSYLEHDAFDPNSLRKIGGEKRNYDACYMTLGSRIDVNLAGLDSFTLQGRLAWVSQLRSQNESIQNFCFGRVPGTFAPSSPYYQGQGAGSNYFWGGAGLRLSLWGALALAGDYDCLVNKDTTLHVGSFGLLFGF